jgi:hypothetical protein
MWESVDDNPVYQALAQSWADPNGLKYRDLAVPLYRCDFSQDRVEGSQVLLSAEKAGIEGMVA